jgi:hypothetical protein
MIKRLGIGCLALVGLIVVVVGVVAVLSLGKVASTAVQPQAFTIKLTGTEGTAFSGSYMAFSADGKSTSTTVAGKVPAQYRIEGAIASVSFQKQSDDMATLRVEILKGQEVAAEANTSAPYGVVSVATR